MASWSVIAAQPHRNRRRDRRRRASKQRGAVPRIVGVCRTQPSAPSQNRDSGANPTGAGWSPRRKCRSLVNAAARVAGRSRREADEHLATASRQRRRRCERRPDACDGDRSTGGEKKRRRRRPRPPRPTCVSPSTIACRPRRCDVPLTAESSRYRRGRPFEDRSRPRTGPASTTRGDGRRRRGRAVAFGISLRGVEAASVYFATCASGWTAP